jgi:hypothetical protein
VVRVDVLVFLTPLIVGFTASAEFASFSFVHPVIRRLGSGDRIRVEQGLLKTFGRVMPVLMPLSAVATVAFAVAGDDGGGNVLRWVSVGLVLLSVITTVAVNVPINAATSRWIPKIRHGTGRQLGSGGSSSRGSERCRCCWPSS